MSVISAIRKRISEGLANNTSLAVLSLLIALIVWFMISLSLNPSEPKTLNEIPLSVSTDGSSVADNNLTVISCDVEKVKI